MAGKPSILIILGPTASGKSALADAIARKRGGEILSVDSMQVYRWMDIGTAKPASADRAAVGHHLLDLVDPDQSFTVATFVEAADAAIADCHARSVPVIATGGTPLYYKSLFQGLFDGPPADTGIRQRLHAQDGQELHKRLAAIDPQAASRIHANDIRRLIRALEVFELTGKPISSFQTDWDSPAQRHEAIWFGLLWDREALNRRINARVKTMIAAGWLDETRVLLQRFGKLSPTAGEATGYRELIDHLQGRISLDDAIEQIKIATRQLARKQMKWFKRFANVQWLEGDRPIDENADRILQFWRNSTNE
jgi:tRNA dimethylallyltransferase